MIRYHQGSLYLRELKRTRGQNEQNNAKKKDQKKKKKPSENQIGSHFDRDVRSAQHRFSDIPSNTNSKSLGQTSRRAANTLSKKS
jgi:hypothetical protein